MPGAPRLQAAIKTTLAWLAPTPATNLALFVRAVLVRRTLCWSAEAAALLAVIQALPPGVHPVRLAERGLARAPLLALEPAPGVRRARQSVPLLDRWAGPSLHPRRSGPPTWTTVLAACAALGSLS